MYYVRLKSIALYLCLSGVSFAQEQPPKPLGMDEPIAPGKPSLNEIDNMSDEDFGKYITAELKTLHAIQRKNYPEEYAALEKQVEEEENIINILSKIISQQNHTAEDIKQVWNIFLQFFSSTEVNTILRDSLKTKPELFYRLPEAFSAPSDEAKYLDLLLDMHMLEIKPNDPEKRERWETFSSTLLQPLLSNDHEN